MFLPVTAVFAGLMAFWLLYLQAQVIRFRWRRQVSLGDAGHEDGMRVIRAHGNATETIPLYLILMGLSEGMGAPGWVVALFGLAFLAGRVSHGLHFVLDRPGLIMRQIGMLLTMIPMGLLALGVILHALAR